MRTSVPVFLFLLAGCAAGTAPTVPTAQTAPKKAVTRAEFKSQWVGKTTDDLLAAFGRPHRTADFDGFSVWTYHDILTDPVTGKPDIVTEVVIRGGKVEKTNW